MTHVQNENKRVILLLQGTVVSLKIWHKGSGIIILQRIFGIKQQKFLSFQIISTNF